MIQTHLTVDGGEQWLSWAYGRVRALRALDLPFMTKRYEMGDGSSVVVRLAGEHTYIELKGAPGGYVCLPHANAFPQGDKSDAQGNPMVPEAVTTLKKTSDAPIEYDAKVKQHKKVETGTNDWRGKVNDKDAILTYSAHNKRYRMFEAPPDPQPHLYLTGKKISTRFLRNGVVSDQPVLGAGIATSPDGTQVLVFFSPDWSTGNYQKGDVFYRTLSSTEWWKAGTFDLTPYVLGTGAPTGFVDPVYFSPDGKKFVTIIRVPYIWERGRKLEATITLTDRPGGVVTAVADFTVDAEAATPTINEYVHTPGAPSTSAPYAVISGTERRDTYSGTNHTWQVTEWAYNIEVTQVGTPSSTIAKNQYTYPVAYDYDGAGVMHELEYRTTTESSDVGTASGTGAGVYVGDSGVSTLIDSGVVYGTFTPGGTTTGSPPVDWTADIWPLLVAAAAENQNSSASYKSSSSAKTELLLDGVPLATLEGSRTVSDGGFTTRARGVTTGAGLELEHYDITDANSRNLTHRTFVVHHVDMRDASYVISALERKTTDTAYDPEYNFKFYTSAKTADGAATHEFEEFLSKAVIAHGSPSGRYVFGARASAGAYASRKKGEYLMSTSSRKIWDDLKDFLQPANTLPQPPTLARGATKAVSETSNATKALFTLGGYDGFAINPITIF